MVARVSLYHLSKPSELVMELNLPKKVKDCQMLWNFEGSALLANAMSDVDETGNSYFGSTYLYWLKPGDRKKLEVCGADKGLVQDLAWSPTSNEFMVIVGMLPAAVCLYNGNTGRFPCTFEASERQIGEESRELEAQHLEVAARLHRLLTLLLYMFGFCDNYRCK